MPNRQIFYCLAIIAFTGCSAVGKRNATYEGSHAAFVVPKGWEIRPVKRSAGVVLVPAERDTRVSIEVRSDFCESERADEKGAQDYIDYVHTMQDPDATLKAAGKIKNSSYGEHIVYRVRADYHSRPNERLVVFMSHGSRCVDIELFSADVESTMRHIPALETVATSLTFR